ncbi:MAG: redoxin domain-containing protein [Chitinophagaceae bacterium]|nr:redoxin domain-containing protein [Chitinophagaceae bacterium]
MIRTLSFAFKLLLFILAPVIVSAQGYEIKVKIDGFTKNEIILAYQLGSKTYVKDTAARENDGSYVFRGPDTLKTGMFLIVGPPSNVLLTILADEKNQRFSISTNLKDPGKYAKFTGSAENKLFNDYRQYIADQKWIADSLKGKNQDPDIDAVTSGKIDKKLKALDSTVKKYQTNFIAKYPTTLTALIIKANIEPVPPVFTGTEDDKYWQLLNWTRAHVFDNANLAEDRLLRTSFLASKVDYYLDKLTVQHPDSINLAVDRVLALCKPSKSNYQFFLSDLLNKYARSTTVGMDAVYVHLALTYYDNGKADWIEKENLNKILSNARALEPILIGKTAPDFSISDITDNHKVTLNDFKANMTILFFWSPDCDVCRKTAGFVLKAAEKYKDKGLRVFSVNTAGMNLSVDAGKNFVTQNKMESFLNTSDPLNIGQIKNRYDIRSTPQLFILDKNKKILFKKLGGEQLDEILTYLIKQENL